MNATTRCLALALAPVIALSISVAPAEAATKHKVHDQHRSSLVAKSADKEFLRTGKLPLSNAELARKAANKTLKANLTVTDPNLEPGQSTTFRTKGSKAKRGVKSLVITFGDGSRATSKKLSTTKAHAYAKPGTYTATLVVKDKRGAKATVKRTVLVAEAGLPNGVLPPKAEDDKTVQGDLAPGAGTPASADLRGSAMPVQNQGQINSCVSWTTAYAMMGYYYKQKYGQQLPFAPMYTYSQTFEGYDAAGNPNGSWAKNALEVLRTQGVDTAAHYGAGWATDWKTQPNASQRANAANYRISGWDKVFSHSNLAGANAAEIEAMKAHLAAGHPVAIAFRVRQDFMNYKSGWYNGTGAYTNGLHEMLALGYDANGLFIQNSWGTGHGVNGYTYMTWGAVQRDLFEAMYAQGMVGGSNPVVNGDSVKPSITGFSKQFGVGYVANNNQAPMTFKWSGSDNVGVSKYVLYYRAAGGAWSQLAIADNATSATFNLQFGSSYEFAIGAYDAAGNQSDWSMTGAFTPGNYAESVASYSGAWYSYSNSAYMNGQAYETSAAGAQMSVQVTGTNFGLVSTKGPQGGRAAVYLDGTYQFTIDNYAAQAGYRSVVGWFNFGSRSTHTVTVVVEGTSGRPYVGVDSFLLS